MSALRNLSDVEFEEVVADLLRATTGRRHRVFRRGADGGVDLRFAEDSVIEVTQCKHFVNSNFGQLHAEARKEAAKVGKLTPPPTRYRFVTSLSLTVKQIATLRSSLAPWVTQDADIWDGKEVDRLLAEHQAVLRQHVKLWLPSGGALGALLHSASHHRSQALVSTIEETLPRYVQTRRFFDAQKLLADTGTCLIAGEAGIGKTTLAQMLLLDLANQGFEPIEVGANIEEAWSVRDAHRPQAFYYDDFLGRSAVGERLGKNEDRGLLQLIKTAAKDPRAVRLILTTREYILQEATSFYETFQRAGLDARRFLLAVPDYTRTERAAILYNHLFHSPVLTRQQLSQLVKERAYIEVIDHEHYNPRVIEFITGLGSNVDLPAEATRDYPAFVLGALEHPRQIWQYAFERELNSHQQAVLVLLASMPSRVTVEALRLSFESTYESPRLAFKHALKSLEMTFVTLEQVRGETTATFANPSLEDFMADVLADEPKEMQRLFVGATAFEQLETLWDLGRVAGSTEVPSPRLASAFSRFQQEIADSVVRLVNAPSITLSPHYGRFGTAHRYPTSQRSRESRLRFALLVSSVGPGARRVLTEWLDRQLAELMEAWTAKRGRASDAVALIDVLQRHRLDHHVAIMIPVLRDWLVEHASTPGDFELLQDLRDVSPEQFGDAEWEDVLEQFERVAEDLIDSEFDDESDIDRLEEVATLLGRYVDDDRLAEARQRFEEPDEEFDIDERRAASVPDREDPDADIDAMFERLEDGTPDNR